jgi:hypothetical protein
MTKYLNLWYLVFFSHFTSVQSTLYIFSPDCYCTVILLTKPRPSWIVQVYVKKCIHIVNPNKKFNIAHSTKFINFLVDVSFSIQKENLKTMNSQHSFWGWSINDLSTKSFEFSNFSNCRRLCQAFFPDHDGSLKISVKCTNFAGNSRIAFLGKIVEFCL